MFKLILSLYLFIFILNNLQAQSNYEFLGAIKLNDTSIISYKLEFKERNNKIRGYSITDLGGEHETKSEIIGQYLEGSNNLEFHENSIIYTKSDVVQDDFCMIFFSSKKFRLGKTQILEGDFIGKFQDGTACINGDIIMNSLDKVNHNILKVNKKLSRIKRIPDSIKAKIDGRKMIDTLSMNMLRKDKQISIYTESNFIDLSIFDGGKEDGDSITIIVDGHNVLNNFVISHEEKLVKIPLQNKTTFVTVKAVNVGEISTNTAVLRLNDGKYNIRAMTNLEAGEETHMVIRKK